MSVRWKMQRANVINESSLHACRHHGVWKIVDSTITLDSEPSPRPFPLFALLPIVVPVVVTFPVFCLVLCRSVTLLLFFPKHRCRLGATRRGAAEYRQLRSAVQDAMRRLLRNVWQRRPVNCCVAVTTATQQCVAVTTAICVFQYLVSSGLPTDVVGKHEIHHLCWKGTFDNLHLMKGPTCFNAGDGPWDEDVGRLDIIAPRTSAPRWAMGPRMPCGHLDGNALAHGIEEGVQGAMQICTQDANIGFEK